MREVTQPRTDKPEMDLTLGQALTLFVRVKENEVAGLTEERVDFKMLVIYVPLQLAKNRRLREGSSFIAGDCEVR